MKALNSYFDHTLLRADACQQEIRKLCREAEEYEFASVCVNGCYVPLAASILQDSPVLVTAVTGFPLGAMSSATKYAETDDALTNGADEIDTVINIGALKDGNYDLVQSELEELAKLCHAKSALLKVILETCLLTDEQICNACILAQRAEADFVKTSTGFSAGGATVHAVRLMKETVGDTMQIKASGGIRTLHDARQMIEAGADRLGCSASVDIMKEYAD